MERMGPVRGSRGWRVAFTCLLSVAGVVLLVAMATPAAGSLDPVTDCDPPGACVTPELSAGCGPAPAPPCMTQVPAPPAGGSPGDDGDDPDSSDDPPTGSGDPPVVDPPDSENPPPDPPGSGDPPADPPVVDPTDPPPSVGPPADPPTGPPGAAPPPVVEPPTAPGGGGGMPPRNVVTRPAPPDGGGGGGGDAMVSAGRPLPETGTRAGVAAAVGTGVGLVLLGATLLLTLTRRTPGRHRAGVVR